MDIQRFLSMLALALALFALLMALSGCAPTRESFTAACVEQAAAAMREPFYQPGGSGFPWRENAYNGAMAECQATKWREYHRVYNWDDNPGRRRVRGPW
jgi:ABC-type sugar transport system substrate-binding protein